MTEEAVKAKAQLFLQDIDSYQLRLSSKWNVASNGLKENDLNNMKKNNKNNNDDNKKNPDNISAESSNNGAPTSITKYELDINVLNTIVLSTYLTLYSPSSIK